MYQLVLASKSPRRIELLKELGANFTTYSSNFEEITGETAPEGHTAEQIAIHNSLGKAKEASNHFKNALIIGVDTVGESHGHILGKPKDREDAKRLIRLISGTTHKVVSAITIINTVSGKSTSTVTETLVTMEKMDEKDIEAYVQSGEGDDKAASYAIQGKGALFVQKIEGDYFNVVGLPIYTLKKLLREFGVELI
ncbi:septum formation protein Maf [Candidatus Peregrinibacteria bacterium]|jgi:septum formation protein|nr:septum formation protein Maf [Candidatus Peregrinibacteria bacterium]MBT4055795.1 septum formation protein Maf [Candidatus Peregrinibacteria bacterium]